MATVEADGLLRADDLANHRRDARKDLRWRVVGDVRREDDAAVELPLVIANTTLQQLAIRDDNLLTTHAPHARRLEADSLDGALHLVDGNRIADVKWFVEDDR